MNIKTDRRIRIELKSVGVDPRLGSSVATWSLWAVVWAEIQDELPSRSETIKTGLALSTKRARVRIRHRRDLDSSMRVIFDGRIYQIISELAEINHRNHIEFMIETASS